MTGREAEPAAGAHPRFPGPGTRVRLVGEGLVLREWAAADVPAMTALFDDPDTARFTPLASPFDEAAARAYLARAAESRAAGRKLQLAVTEDGGAPLGEVLLFTAVDYPLAVEAGYAIGPRHRGRGLAARALRPAVAYAYGTLGAQRVLLRIVAENAASRAVARATGFSLTDQPPVAAPGGALLQTWQHAGPPGP
ncbi:GNAT family N-acetyltransferase [Streptomyces sp. NPDC047002]|uniref:GNAT family N-acetyltransferase n=1 Tax=Streptomyces sp. NPDC047002 TaxID=3155475 RepID=UPI003452E93C